MLKRKRYLYLNESECRILMGLVNVMSRETVLRQYVDEIKKDYDF